MAKVKTTEGAAEVKVTEETTETKTKEETVSIIFRCAPELKRELNTLAAVENRNISQQIAHFVKEGLEKDPTRNLILSLKAKQAVEAQPQA